jgi:uroporphyrinogen decarboxylase
MTQMHHPLVRAVSVADLEAYPWPDFEHLDFSYLKPLVAGIHARGLAVFLWAECTIWETAWYLRRMDNLFVDMATDDPMAVFLMDKIANLACFRAEKFAEAGVDILGLGDDIGMQSTIMMSLGMYRKWIKPRLAQVIAAAKAIKPEILISYHSCGYILPFIEDLINVGVDILNPVQPECMDFAEVHAKFGSRLSFNGTLGTQKLMPFGTPEQIKAEVRRNLDRAGPRGGLFCCPTHMLEPEVPWANIEAYVEAVREFQPGC